MNIGDKITWGYRSLFILTLIWLRFIEPLNVSVWGIWPAWAVIMFFILFPPRRKNIKNNHNQQTKNAPSE